MVYCHNDSFQPRYPAISEVRYVGMRVGECGWVERTDERFARAWYRDNYGAGSYTFQADGPGTNPWAVRVMAKRESEDPGDRFYTVTMDPGMGVRFYFDMGS